MGTAWPDAPVFRRDEIARVLPRKAVLGAVREAFIAQARGEVVSPPPGALLFDDPSGDCHIKFGWKRGEPLFVVKVATGFYTNPARGLPTNNGLVLAFSATSGETIAILNDGGLLTSLRTAAAGALAARAGAPRHVECLGILGTGHQAELQADWASEALCVQRVLVWGRDEAKALRLVEKLRAMGRDADAAASPASVLARSQVVISCTPAAAPIVENGSVRPGTHLVALGADSTGKSEVDPELFARAERIATDDHAQCCRNGDFGIAVNRGAVGADADVSLGSILAGDETFRRSQSGITIADLTGIPAQDIAIATLALRHLIGRRI